LCFAFLNLKDGPTFDIIILDAANERVDGIAHVHLGFLRGSQDAWLAILVVAIACQSAATDIQLGIEILERSSEIDDAYVR
jgi:hypothetical protein